LCRRAAQQLDARRDVLALAVFFAQVAFAQQPLGIAPSALGRYLQPAFLLGWVPGGEAALLGLGRRDVPGLRSKRGRAVRSALSNGRAPSCRMT
jgi:hypothetical protein